MPRLIRLSEVFKMLDECVPDYEARESDHYWRITHPDGRIFPRLPKGKHGANRPEVQRGHVKRLVKLFEIEEQAAEMIPELFPKKKQE